MHEEKPEAEISVPETPQPKPVDVFEKFKNNPALMNKILKARAKETPVLVSELPKEDEGMTEVLVGDLISDNQGRNGSASTPREVVVFAGDETGSLIVSLSMDLVNALTLTNALIGKVIQISGTVKKPARYEGETYPSFYCKTAKIVKDLLHPVVDAPAIPGQPMAAQASPEYRKKIRMIFQGYALQHGGAAEMPIEEFEAWCDKEKTTLTEMLVKYSDTIATTNGGTMVKLKPLPE